MKILKNIIRKILLFIIGYEFFENKIFLEGVKIANEQKIDKIRDLSSIEFSVFSQWGDDGIINWLTKLIPIKNKIFIEIGTEDYKESNTRFLLKYQNWSGHLYDADNTHISNIKKQSIYWKYDIKAHNFMINKDNINKIIGALKIPKEIGLLSLDIDGIDYWIWKELSIIKPIIFVCEFNSVFGNLKKVSVPYMKNFERTKFHYSNLAFGASLKAFKFISQKKGYIFIGTNSNGVNAYFIKKKYYKYLKDKIISKRSFNSKLSESRNKLGQKTFIRGLDRVKLIENLDLFDLDNNKKVKLKNLKKINSRNWF